MDNNTDDFQNSLPARKKQTTQLTLIISITIIAIMAVASVSLIYFRRRKGKP